MLYKDSTAVWGLDKKWSSEKEHEIKNKNKKKVRLVFVCVELSYISEDNIKQHLK